MARTPVLAQLRTELGRYLRRHGTPESDYEGADLAVSELVTNAVRHAPGPAWMHVDWTERRPRVEIHDLGPGFEPPAGAPTASAAAGANGLYLRLKGAIGGDLYLVGADEDKIVLGNRACPFATRPSGRRGCAA